MNRLFQFMAVALIALALAPAALALTACLTVDEHACCPPQSRTTPEGRTSDCCVVQAGDRPVAQTPDVTPRATIEVVRAIDPTPVVAVVPPANNIVVAAEDISPQQSVLCTFLN